MNCYDCALENKVVPAIAVCAHCGCGLCMEHACVIGQAVQRPAGMGPSSSRTLARRVICSVCHEAEVFGPVQHVA
ncbi:MULTISPECIES: DUF2180 family protein [unclassified Streptomyces]|uniref:DUF2180 family protein n=1 Tax=unclassified Streptomyces TaxID=2593676 RepID=UPI001F04DBB7|nr:MULTISPECIES: DUF2180 family protein [unclassified Streptomyces]MCH0562318.1 DUF2180 family protein [Streptomyces sp. MUM 2J]MCH0572921.1 DUF2180 family protein [Streptomyces sp. MUM 136J]